MSAQPRLWAKYFLNEEGRKNHNAYYQAGMLSKTLLESVMSVWHHREGAARLMVWLLFKTQFNRSLPLNVQALMEIAYGPEKVEHARQSSEPRKKLVGNWDEDLVTLSEHGWKIQFDPETYPLELQPAGFGRETAQRPRGFFDNLLAARLWIAPEEALVNEVAALDTMTEAMTQATPLQAQPRVILSGSQVRALRIARGWSQRKLALLSSISQGRFHSLKTMSAALPKKMKRFSSRCLTSALRTHRGRAVSDSLSPQFDYASNYCWIGR